MVDQFIEIGLVGREPVENKYSVSYDADTITVEYSKSFFLIYFIFPLFQSFIDLDFNSILTILSIISEFILENSFKNACLIFLTFLSNDIFYFLLHLF